MVMKEFKTLYNLSELSLETLLKVLHSVVSVTTKWLPQDTELTTKWQSHPKYAVIGGRVIYKIFGREDMKNSNSNSSAFQVVVCSTGCLLK